MWPYVLLELALDLEHLHGDELIGYRLKDVILKLDDDYTLVRWM